jgi:hypothetical protein
MEILNFLVDSWEIIGLLITNIAALFMHPPFREKKTDSL